MTSTAMKRRDLDQTQGGGGELRKRPQRSLKNRQFRPAFNREITVSNVQRPIWRLFA